MEQLQRLQEEAFPQALSGHYRDELRRLQGIVGEAMDEVTKDVCYPHCLLAKIAV